MAEGLALSAGRKNKRQLWIVLGLTTTYMLAEVIGGLLTRSLALLADAGHMFTDAGALALALFAIRVAERSATPEKSYGYLRTEILAALANAVILLLISVYILYEAWQRFQRPPEVLSGPMLVVAVIGLTVNLIGIRLLSQAAGESLNAKGAYLEVLSDTLGSLGVIIASLIMLRTGWYLADPIVGAGIGLFIIPRTWTLLREAIHVLMEGTPERLQLSTIEEEMKRVDGVLSVHDLHVWTLTSGLDCLSSHVTVADSAQNSRILSELERLLQEKFQIAHSTIQLEEPGRAPERIPV